jgi:hypothetical protein
MMRKIVCDVNDLLNNLVQDWREGEWKHNDSECCVGFSRIECNSPHEFFSLRLRKNQM